MLPSKGFNFDCNHLCCLEIHFTICEIQNHLDILLYILTICEFHAIQTIVAALKVCYREHHCIITCPPRLPCKSWLLGSVEKRAKQCGVENKRYCAKNQFGDIFANPCTYAALLAFLLKAPTIGIVVLYCVLLKFP